MKYQVSALHDPRTTDPVFETGTEARAAAEKRASDSFYDAAWGVWEREDEATGALLFIYYRGQWYYPQ